MKAILFTYTADGQSFATEFEGPDAVLKAQGLKAGIEDDWPGAIWAIGRDQEANEANARRLTRAVLGITDEG